MTTFDEREKAFETKFEHDMELRSKARARRNKLLGLWAAGLMGKSGDAAEAYARDIVMADFEKSGEHDVVHTLMHDLAAAGKPTDEHTIRRQGDGQWEGNDRDTWPEVTLVVRLKSGTVLWPTQRVLKRLENGAENGLYPYGVVILRE